MLGGIISFLVQLCLILCWVAPFTFVFFLIAARKEAVNGGNKAINFGQGAACSLLVMLVAAVLGPGVI